MPYNNLPNNGERYPTNFNQAYPLRLVRTYVRFALDVYDSFPGKNKLRFIEIRRQERPRSVKETQKCYKLPERFWEKQDVPILVEQRSRTGRTRRNEQKFSCVYCGLFSELGEDWAQQNFLLIPFTTLCKT